MTQPAINGLPSAQHHKIVIDGDVILDDHLGEWQHTPPEQLREYITPVAGQRPQPGIQALLICLADAAVGNHPLDAILTNHADGGFTLQVSGHPE